MGYNAKLGRPHLHRTTRPLLRLLPPHFGRKCDQFWRLWNTDSADRIRQSESAATYNNARLLAVPVVGTAPLTVDFYVGLANFPDSLFYEWNFGDGALSSCLPVRTCFTFTSIPGRTCAR